LVASTVLPNSDTRGRAVRGCKIFAKGVVPDKRLEKTPRAS
jgi:hypothetical protein